MTSSIYDGWPCFKEYFRDDALGFKRYMEFMPWHFGFFCRYRQGLTLVHFAAKPEPFLSLKLTATTKHTHTKGLR